jgi:hypothetical protein
MNVKELMEILAEMPPELEVIVERHSDYGYAGEPQITKAIGRDFYVRRWYPELGDGPEVENFLLI